MGGIRVDADMRTRVEGLYAAGEAVGGANGANRLSGNAITEALVFGERAGGDAAARAKRASSCWDDATARAVIENLSTPRDAYSAGTITPIALQAELQKLMWEKAGPFRTGGKLDNALGRIERMKKELPQLNIGVEGRFNLNLQDWFELRAMLITAEAVVKSALSRTESRGAHQREDFPAPNDSLLKNQVLELNRGALVARWSPPVRLNRSCASHE